jgi:hypothetical protein
MIGAVVDLFVRNEEAARVLIYDIAAGAPFLRKLKAKRPELFLTFARLSDALRTMMDAGLLPPMNPDKAIVFASTVFLLLPLALSNLDLLRPAGSAAHADLTDPEAWKGFLVDLLLRIMQGPAEAMPPLAVIEKLY